MAVSDPSLLGGLCPRCFEVVCECKALAAEEARQARAEAAKEARRAKAEAAKEERAAQKKARTRPPARRRVRSAAPPTPSGGRRRGPSTASPTPGGGQPEEIAQLAGGNVVLRRPGSAKAKKSTYAVAGPDTGKGRTVLTSWTTKRQALADWQGLSGGATTKTVSMETSEGTS